MGVWSVKKLAEQLESGDERGFRDLYLALKPGFLKYGESFRCTREEIEEAYNDTFVVLHDNILLKKVVALESSLKAYVFGIGKYMLYAQRRTKGRSVTAIGETFLPAGFTPPVAEVQTSEHVKIAIRALGPKCREVLQLYYYKRYSIEAIQHTLGYKNENTVKAHKSRCMKQLKQFITDQSKKDGDNR